MFKVKIQDDKDGSQDSRSMFKVKVQGQKGWKSMCKVKVKGQISKRMEVRV